MWIHSKIRNMFYLLIIVYNLWIYLTTIVDESISYIYICLLIITIWRRRRMGVKQNTDFVILNKYNNLNNNLSIL